MTGNIGEAIASIIARRMLKLPIKGIAHIRPNQSFRRRKAPDYLMRLGPTPDALQSIWPPGASGPMWWPVESKARNTSSAADAGVREGFVQLAAYWHTVCAQYPASVGYGLVISFKYNPEASITTVLFVPKNHVSLVQKVTTTSYDDFVRKAATDADILGCLHDC